MIHFQCPHCDAKLKVPEAHAGKRGACPHCHGKLTVPAAPEPELELIKDDLPPSKPASSRLLEDLAVQPLPRPVGKSQDTIEDRLAQRLLDSIAGDSTAEHTGVRPWPWPLDILLYPASMGGLTTLVIIVVLPFLLRLLPLGLTGFLIRGVIGFYSAWYLAECVYDSAKGGIRAPMAMDTTDLGEMWSRVLYLTAVYILFVFPAFIYQRWTHHRDPIFWGLVAWGIVFFPMGLLAMVINDSTSALNPFFLLGSIFRTFLPYLGLILLLGLLAALLWLLASLLPRPSGWNRLLQLPVSFATTWMSFSIAHVLGRFYWRYREQLDWGL